MVVTLYCIAVIFAYLPTLFPPHGALDGLGVVLLTLPWISLVIDVLDALDPEIIGHPLWGNLAVLICAGINASILYFATYWAVRFLGNRNKETGPSGENLPSKRGHGPE